jgi:hypothetical protein
METDCAGGREYPRWELEVCSKQSAGKSTIEINIELPLRF